MIANRDTRKGYIVTVNGGSSSIKFGLFALSPRLRPILSGKVERIGLRGTKLTATSMMTRQSHSVFLNASAPAGCVKPLLDFLEEKVGLNRVSAIAHCIVHGGVRYCQPHWISSELVDALRDLCPLDPDHLPLEISLIEACTERDPKVPQVACFDTAFHAGMPTAAYRRGTGNSFATSSSIRRPTDVNMHTHGMKRIVPELIFDGRHRDRIEA